MKAVISLTTIPSRLDSLPRCVEGLVGQGLPVYMWLPRYVARLGDGFAEVPAFLEMEGVHAEIVEDRGPATKLLPALERFEVVLTADDDHLYGPGWAAGLLAWAERRPAAALGYRGRRFVGGLSYQRSRKVVNPPKPVPVDLITGVHGALYRRRSFSDGFTEEWAGWPLNDDIVTSGHLWRRGVPLLVIPRHCRITAMAARRIDRLTAGNVDERLNEAGLRRVYRGWSRAR